MADIILPIAKKLAKQVPELLLMETKFLYKVSKEVKSVEEKLNLIGSDLKKADVMTDQEEEFDRWVSQLRDLAFKAEDVIEVFINNATPYDGCDVFQLIMGFFCQLTTLHKLKNEIDDINSKLANLSKEKPEIRERSPEGGDETSNPLRERGGASSKTKEDDIVGFREEAGQLTSWLTEKEPQGRLVVVSIWAQGGAGKSTLAQKIYKSSFVKSQFDCIAWVSVSQKYDVKDIWQAISEQVGKKVTTEEKEEYLEMVDINIAREKVHACLKGKDYLIILDDLWKQKEFDILVEAFPTSPEKKCRILLTTRTNQVAGLATCRLNLPDLNEEDSMELFLKKVYRFSPDKILTVSEEKKHWARKILSKCKGLPIAIVLLGGILSPNRIDTTAWRDLSDRMHSALVNSGDIVDIRKVLTLSYIELPYHLRSCFLYFGLFPEDSVIDCDKLIRLWLAEGFLEQRVDDDAMEDVAEQCLEGLIQRSMIQILERKSNGKPQICRTHDLIRDLAIQEAKKTKFSSVSKDQPLVLVEGIRRLVLRPKDTDQIHGVSGTVSLQSLLQSSRMRPHIVEEDDLVGVQEEVDKLASSLKNEVPLGLGWLAVVSIVGDEGTGKTAVARKVYNNVKSHFDFRAWVYVSSNYTIQYVLWSILEQVTTLKDAEIKLMDEEESQRMVHNLLEGKSFLIVLDNLQWQEDWDAIKRVVFPKPVKRDQKCRVLLTGSHHIEPSTICIELGRLNEDLSLKLFLKTVFKCSQNEIPDARLSKEMKDIARKMVVEYCQGLPCAILPLGSLLSEKSKDVCVWSHILESLNQEVVWGATFQKVFLLCFLDLPDLLRSCIRYFNCIPRHCAVESKMLIQQWAEQGLLKSGDNKAIEDVGRDCLEVLIQRNLLDVMKWKSNEDPQTCILLSHFYTFLRVTLYLYESDRRSKNNSCSLPPVRPDHPKDSEVQYGTSTAPPPPPLPLPLPLPHSQPKTFSLSHLLSSLNPSQFFRFPNHVSSLLCFSKNPQLGFEQFPLLRVLDLEGAEQIEELPNEVRNLTLLRYLSLRGTRVKVIPNWIANLRNLQTLDAPASKIPMDALHLRKLRYLFSDSFYPSSSSSSAPHLCINIGVLEHLHTLELDSSDWIISGLHELNNLRVLRLHGGGDQDNVLRAIAILTRLKSLSLISAKASSPPSPVHLPSFSNHSDLDELILEGTRIQLPILKLHIFPPVLTYLWLEIYVNYDVNPFSTLQHLPYLKKLCLRLFGANSGMKSKTTYCTKGFPRLEFLYISVDFMINHRDFLGLHWTVEQGAFHNLKVLHIETEDWWLGNLPIGLRHVTTLKELIITRGYDVRSNLLRRTGKDWDEVKDIQSLSIKYLETGA